MCVFEYGESIRSNEDVRNLVISLVLRQERSFTQADIVEQARLCLNDSPLEISDRTLNALVADSLWVLLNNRDVAWRNGEYVLRNVFEYV